MTHLESMVDAANEKYDEENARNSDGQLTVLESLDNLCKRKDKEIKTLKKEVADLRKSIILHAGKLEQERLQEALMKVPVILLTSSSLLVHTQCLLAC
mgnify:FL=1